MADTFNSNFDLKTLEPNNTDAEAAILGTCLAAPRQFDRLQGALEKIDFYEVVYADTWKAMQEMAKDNRRADLITLAPLLNGRKVGEVSAIEHLQLLVEMYSGPGQPANEGLDAYVNEIRRYSAQRAMAAAARDLNARSLDMDPDLAQVASKAISELDAALQRARGTERTGALLGVYAAEAIDLYKDPNAASGISTGLKDLDAMTGGLYRGEMSILGGRPGSGKTTIAAQIQLNVARRGIGTLMVSLEMGGISVAERMLASDAYTAEMPIPYTLFRTDKLSRPENRKMGERGLRKMEESRDRLAELPFYLEEQTGLTVAQIGALIRKVRGLYEKRGIELALVIVDYLGLVVPTGTYRGQKVNEVGEISGGLKRLAKQLDVHMLALHQLSRGVEGRDDKRPQLHDLRDSGNIEQDTDLAMFAYREAYYLERQNFSEDAEREQTRLDRLEAVKNTLEINIGKQRSGIVGSQDYFCRIDCNYISNAGQK